MFLHLLWLLVEEEYPLLWFHQTPQLSKLMRNFELAALCWVDIGQRNPTSTSLRSLRTPICIRKTFESGSALSDCHCVPKGPEKRHLLLWRDSQTDFHYSGMWTRDDTSRTKKVCAVQVKNTGKMYACKKLDKKRLKKKNGEKMALLEKEILERISSPFIVSLAYAFESKSHLCLVMSLMNGGDLKFHIYSVGTRGLAMSRVVFYSAQMTCGLLHLHSLGIVYRDLKPENVLLDDVGNCRLSDLGLAMQIQDGRPVTQKAGTNGYMAPEILMEKVSYSYPVDWFAMGCSIYEMVAGRTPFKDYKEKISKEDLKQRTLKEEVTFQHDNFTEEAKDICRLFLAKKPEQRLGSREIEVRMVDPREGVLTGMGPGEAFKMLEVFNVLIWMAIHRIALFQGLGTLGWIPPSGWQVMNEREQAEGCTAASIFLCIEVSPDVTPKDKGGETQSAQKGSKQTCSLAPPFFL
ncbi:PREDICTED: G protein-coupled receptor kinase 7 isoform X2 [Myotis brandtii]|uniref:G protein-coupled receptor kinase 7 isoform X2 n=1 Tax=Myotis brandtii TaxID=109478 RepID=UPI000703F18A|nr:PREDICTED: G protein-coupled receptor kinase 7 isoform X2 [Myotis brandtii]